MTCFGNCRASSAHCWSTSSLSRGLCRYFLRIGPPTTVFRFMVQIVRVKKILSRFLQGQRPYYQTILLVGMSHAHCCPASSLSALGTLSTRSMVFSQCRRFSKAATAVKHTGKSLLISVIFCRPCGPPPQPSAPSPRRKLTVFISQSVLYEPDTLSVRQLTPLLSTLANVIFNEPFFSVLNPLAG